MAIPFTVDISAFYGEPDFREQDSGTIVDRRKTLNLHKELETPVNNTPKRAKKRGATKRAPAELQRIVLVPLASTMLTQEEVVNPEEH